MRNEKDGGFIWQILNMFQDSPRQQQKKVYQPDEYHWFTVEKPFCCPSRDIITAALHPIGIPVFEIKEWVENQALDTFAERMKIELKTFENLKYGPMAPGFLPMAIRASFAVPKRRAEQAEYWLWRTRRLIVIDGEINPRNKIAAIKHNGKMPRASDPSKGQAYAKALQSYASASPNQPAMQAPMLESSCKQARELWDQVNKMAKNAKSKRNKTKKGWFW